MADTPTDNPICKALQIADLLAMSVERDKDKTEESTIKRAALIGKIANAILKEIDNPAKYSPSRT